MVKKVTAPKSYDPGKGRPREHLVYINQKEMDYLRKINGNNMERGPKGLRSFPPEDAVGSSSNAGNKGNTGKGSSNTGGGNKGNSNGNTGRGAGSNYGAGSGRPSSGGGGNKGNASGPSRGSGGSSNRGATDNSKGNTGRGAGSNYGAGSGRPSSGAGGQRGGGYNSGSSGSRGGGASTQKAGAGGNAGKVSPGSYGVSKAVSSGMRGAGSNYGPGSARPNLDKALNQAGQVRDAKNTLKNNESVRGDLRESGIRTINVGPMGTSVSVGPVKSPTKGNISRSLSQASIQAMKEQYGAYKNVNAPAQQLVGDALGERLSALNKAEQEYKDVYYGFDSPVKTGSPTMAGATLRKQDPLAGAGYGTFRSPTEMFNERLKNAMVPDIKIPSPENPSEAGRIVSVEDVPVEGSIPRRMTAADMPGEMALRPGMYRDPLTPEKIQDALRNYTPKPEQVVKRGVTRSGSGLKGITEALTGRSQYSPGDYASYRSGDTFASNDTVPRDEIQRPQTAFDKYSPKIPGVTGKVFGWIDKVNTRAWDKMSPEERLTQMDKWKESRKDNLRGLGGFNDKRPEPGPLPYSYGNKPAVEQDAEVPQKPTGSRPSIYFMWDVGVSIPSPGEPNYTLYQQYLAEHANANRA